MTDQKPKKKKRVPLGAITWGVIGTAALVRAFWNPERAIIKDGFAKTCEGSNCSAYLVTESSGGANKVFAAARGRVVKVTPNSVWIIPNREAVVLEYVVGGSAQIMVREGQTVWQGQVIASAQTVSFAVWRIDRSPTGAVSYTALSPSAWLASRGLRISAKHHKVSAEGSNWCEGGRKLQVPETVGTCGIRLPEPSAVALLPISVTMG